MESLRYRFKAVCEVGLFKPKPTTTTPMIDTLIAVLLGAFVALLLIRHFRSLPR